MQPSVVGETVVAELIAVGAESAGVTFVAVA